MPVGSFSRFGLAVALATAACDQALKVWLLFVYNLPDRGIVPLTPFLDLVLIWNKGISYGLFQQDGPYGQWVLLALKAAAVVLLSVWMARSTSRLTALSLGLIIGGAVGNAIDRVAYGGVADFALLHLQVDSACDQVNQLVRTLVQAVPRAGGCDLQWYVFNLADAAIVAGVMGLLYDSLAGPRAAKQP
jgi:signal peptidase II